VSEERGESSLFYYNPTTSDEVDLAVAEQLKGRPLQIPIRYLGEGYFLFGTRKVFMKMLYNGLTVRDDQTWKQFTEFMAAYYDKEVRAMAAEARRQGLSVEHLSQLKTRQYRGME